MNSKNSIPTYELYNKLERTIPFDIQELQEKQAYDSSKHHRHSYYEVFLFNKGGGDHMIDFKNYSITPGSIHFVSPGQVHLVKRSLDSNGYVLLFSREFYQIGLSNTDSLFELPFFNNYSSDPVLKTEKIIFQELVATIQQIHKEYFSKNADKETIIRAYLNLLFIKLKRLYEDQHKQDHIKKDIKQEAVKNFRVLIEKYFIVNHKPSEYAELMHITTGYLNELVNEVTGKSSTDLINERLILEAKRILFHSNKTISEIATTLNFEDPAYFTRFFKNQTGLSPKEYREEEKNKHN